ncbi:MAG TPA: hypothetical protein VF605_09660 [Allosphingosinicella sp.]|jgi:ABC-type glycerol-3-phosphate transport system substrate-binding protein
MRTIFRTTAALLAATLALAACGPVLKVASKAAGSADEAADVARTADAAATTRPAAPVESAAAGQVDEAGDGGRAVEEVADRGAELGLEQAGSEDAREQ